MLKEIHFSRWKSFEESILYIDPLTVLIGTNASGKSNALDGLEFLSRISLGKDLQSSLTGDPTLKAIRGGAEWAALTANNEFTLRALVQGEDEKTDYLYSITVSTKPYVQLKSETLTRIKERANTKVNPYQTQLIYTDETTEDSPSIIARLYNGKAGTKRECKRSHSILSQLYNLSIQKDVSKGVNAVCEALQGIFILDPIPSLMRNYTAFSRTLNNDASNIAGVLAALPKDEKAQVEQILSKYAKKLPERDITEVYTRAVGEFSQDAMLYCKEDWGIDKEITMDARGMSDGTLRLLGILTALLTRPSGTQIIIEEVDNGLHPSRSKLLLNMIRNISTDRAIDVLVTTHNPALLDELEPEMIPFIVVAHRDNKTGESKLSLLEDIQSLPKLMAYGKVGKLSSEGMIEEALVEEESSNE